MTDFSTSHNRRDQLVGTILLLITAIVWGFAFVAQKVGMDAVGPFTFNGSRYLLGCVTLIPFVMLSSVKKKSNPDKQNNAPSTAFTLIGGLSCGVVLCVASGLQQIGIQYTSVGKAGFITTLYIFFVPLIGILRGKFPTVRIWISVVIAIVGFYFLSITEQFTLSRGDFLMLICAIAFSLHIITVDYFVARIDGVLLACMQFFVSGIISCILMLIFEPVSLEALKQGLIPILYSGIFSAGVGYTLQVLGQAKVSPTRASLLMSLESVFSVVGGFLLLHDYMSPREIMGCVIVFGAVVLAQIGPSSEAS